ncbi:hypothetical protein Tco_1053370, partial [Tanacetum coccineum]
MKEEKKTAHAYREDAIDTEDVTGETRDVEKLDKEDFL